MCFINISKEKFMKNKIRTNSKKSVEHILLAYTQKATRKRVGVRDL